MGDFEQSVQSGVGVGIGMPLDTKDAEIQLTVFPFELGWRSKFKRSSLFNRVSTEYRLGINGSEKSHLFSVRFGIGRMIWSDLSSYGVDLRFGTNEKFNPVFAVEGHLFDSKREGAPGVVLGLEVAVGEETKVMITTTLRWAKLWD